MLKDLGLALDAAASVNADLPMGNTARDMYEELSNREEYRSLDFSSVYKLLAQKRTSS